MFTIQAALQGLLNLVFFMSFLPIIIIDQQSFRFTVILILELINYIDIFIPLRN